MSEKVFYNIQTGDPIVVDASANIEDFEGYQETPVHIVTREEVLRKRLTMLFASDWLATTDRTMSDEEREYRQALRDITDQEAFTNGNYGDIVWPSLLLA